MTIFLIGGAEATLGDSTIFIFATEFSSGGTNVEHSSSTWLELSSFLVCSSLSSEPLFSDFSSTGLTLLCRPRVPTQTFYK